jgi:hypothetical protein
VRAEAMIICVAACWSMGARGGRGGAAEKKLGSGVGGGGRGAAGGAATTIRCSSQRLRAGAEAAGTNDRDTAVRDSAILACSPSNAQRWYRNTAVRDSAILACFPSDSQRWSSGRIQPCHG